MLCCVCVAIANSESDKSQGEFFKVYFHVKIQVKIHVKIHVKIFHREIVLPRRELESVLNCVYPDIPAELTLSNKVELVIDVDCPTPTVVAFC